MDIDRPGGRGSAHPVLVKAAPTASTTPRPVKNKGVLQC